MNPNQALKILSAATEPSAQARLTRGDYVNIEVALRVLGAALQPATTPAPIVPPNGPANGRDVWSEHPDTSPAAEPAAGLPTRNMEP